MEISVLKEAGWTWGERKGGGVKLSNGYMERERVVNDAVIETDDV